MQITPSIAGWLARELGYRNYDIEGNPSLLHKPFVNVYFGAAYIKWLSSHDGKQRSEEYVVRAYKGGIKKATHKSTAVYFERYFSVKRCLPPRRRKVECGGHILAPDILNIDTSAQVKTGCQLFPYFSSHVC
ncbi:hypothetical protein AXF42_Ash005095 [Apostasia shenzhenica]|uniref:Transglycosylase SLT domain-containing protein n=1 Tax=Apostasia shenzhenica TaxID=1088818 RepID=A0A2I0B8G1_9ASPA|nr:hypothetical protein AXF42_Ash005095 [Apostasia shenzhenica]